MRFWSKSTPFIRSCKHSEIRIPVPSNNLMTNALHPFNCAMTFLAYSCEKTVGTFLDRLAIT